MTEPVKPAGTGFFSSAESVVKAVLALLGLLPTAVVALSIIDIPPTVKQMVVLITTIIGLGTVFILFMLQDALKRLTLPRLALLYGGSIVLGCLALGYYMNFAEAHLAEYEGERIITPFSYTEATHKIIYVDYSGLINEALDPSLSSQASVIAKEIEDRNGAAVFVFVALLSVSQLLVVFGLFGALFHVVTVYFKTPDGAEEEPPPTP